MGGPFSLVDGGLDKDFRCYMLVYFGFTYCPDAVGLQVIAAALQKNLGPKADRITPIFITVDPERDTPAPARRRCAKSFDAQPIGLDEVDAAAKAYRVYYKKVQDEKSTAGYTFITRPSSI